MKIIIEKEVFDKLDLHVGVVVAKGIDNKIEEKRISKLLLEVENMIKMDFIPEQLAEHQLISPWKAAFFDFDERPHGVHSSVEKLMKIVLEGESVKEKNKLADLTNYLSLKHIIPITAHDSRKIGDEIIITKARGREYLNVDGEVRHPLKGEIIVKDSSDVLSKRWGLEKAEKTRITEDAKNAIVFVFGLKPIPENKLIDVCKDVADSLNSFCGGESKYYILNKDNSEVDV